MKIRFLVGIDPGTKTGVALWDRQEKKLLRAETVGIIEALDMVEKWFSGTVLKNEVELRFEDARLRRWFGNSDRERLQGVGSVKRDSAIWQEFCEFHGIKFKAIAPKNNRTKTTPHYFKRLTGWQKRTSEHARDAAMLIVGG